MAQDEDKRSQRSQAPVIQEISLPNLPNPAPSDRIVRFTQSVADS